MSRRKTIKKSSAAPRPAAVTHGVSPRAQTVLRSQPIPFRQKGSSHPQQREGRYVYGVIGSASPVTFGKSNLGGVSEDVYAIHQGSLAAVVSRTRFHILDPTRDNALAHEQVIEAVLQAHTILPMSFGAVFRRDDDVRAMLKSIHAPLEDMLRRMDGKLEFGLKVTWDRDLIVEELKHEHDEIRRFHQELTRRRLQSTYFARIQLGRMIEKALAELAAHYVGEIHAGLRVLSVASRDSRPLGDKMILNAAFLVEQDRRPAFDRVVLRLAHRFGDRLNFKLTGPWPPYNFVNIRLKLEEAKAG